MIPPTAHLGTLSPGEVEVFEKLRTEAGSATWTVLHSLDLPVHVSRRMGETDFVVVIPGCGVLCLSVKHHLDVTRTGEGVWYLGQEPPTSQGPFKKARDDMFSLKERLVRADHSLSSVSFGFAVLFTRAKPKAHLTPIEWHVHEQIYSDEYKRRPLSKLLEESLIATRRHLGRDEGDQHPNEAQVESLIEHTRPELEIFISPKDRAEHTFQELKRYTDEQTLALDDAQLNQRILYVGPAGTGKTLLAIEMFRREVNAGRKTLLLCYNRLLREFLEDSLGGQFERPQTADGFLLKLAGIPAPADASQAFWEKTLPDAALAAVLEDTKEPSWDSIIVDEAQDILVDRYLDPIDQVLKGGLTGGRWIMFGDFDRQAIYSPALDCQSFCARSNASVRSLRINCRNTRLIAKYAEILGGMGQGYSTVRRQGDGIRPDLRFYENEAGQEEMLIDVLQTLRKRFEWKDIVILSPKRDQVAAVSTLTREPWKSRFKPFSLGGSGLRFCTIHRFKGLEACAIVVTDVENLGASERASLLYVATTRAVDRLAVLAHSQVQSEIRNALLQQ
jgi:hypothetical protein